MHFLGGIETGMTGTDVHVSGPADTPVTPADLLAATEALGEASYSWNIETDQMNWNTEAPSIFALRDFQTLGTGTAFATLLDPASPASRHSEVFESERRDHGTGVAFNSRYLVNPAPGVRFWIEDNGRWFAGEGGRPRLVHGICRRVLAPSAEEIALVTKRRFDPATGALTRADFCNALAGAIEANEKDSRGLVVMMVAVDGLAELNKIYGYQVGDEIIAAVVRRLRGLIRRRDVLGRYATNKIGLVLAPSLAENMDFVATRIANGVRSTPIETNAGPISASVHIGGVAVPRDAELPVEALNACEEALNDIKDRLDQPFRAYVKDSPEGAARSSSREATDMVISALNDRRIRLAFQSIISTATGRIAMYESLVRLVTPEGVWLGAGQIVPIAEKIGFLHLIDHRVTELAIEALRADPDITLTLNVGADTALHPDWIAAFRANLALDTRVARRLIVEITETSLIEDINAARRLIEQIKECGARVAIDDFGAGHTSFRNMRLLPIDILKIDGTFIKNLARSEDDRFFVQTLLQLARHLGIETVAEWVQDEETAQLLTSWRVEYLQGDFLGAASEGLPLKLKAPLRAVG